MSRVPRAVKLCLGTLWGLAACWLVKNAFFPAEDSDFLNRYLAHSSLSGWMKVYGGQALVCLLLALGIGLVSFLTFRSAYHHETVAYARKRGRRQPPVLIEVDNGAGRPHPGGRNHARAGRAFCIDEHSIWAYRVNELAGGSLRIKGDHDQNLVEPVAPPKPSEEEQRATAPAETTAVPQKPQE